MDLLVGDTLGKITLYLNSGTNNEPILTSSGFIQAGSGDLDVGDRAAPVVVDWNNDGKKDLIVGSDTGYLYIYLNSGENNSPIFSTSSLIQVNNNPVNLYRSSPDVCDLDKDGKKDLIIGEYNGMTYFLKNTGTDSAPQFSTMVELQADGSDIRENNSKVDIADWNGDGHDDLVIGDYYGYISVYLNSGNITTVDDPVIPGDFELHQNYPNPFNPVTTIKINLKEAEQGSLGIYNAKGQHITTLVSGFIKLGESRYIWDGIDDSGVKVASGVYFYRFEPKKFSRTMKMILIR